MSQHHELTPLINEWQQRSSQRCYFCTLRCAPSYLISISVLFLILTYQADQVSAQVNVEQSRLEAKEGLSGSVDGALTLIRGNVSLSQLGLGARLDYTHGVHSPFVQLALIMARRSLSLFLTSPIYTPDGPRCG